MNTPPNEHRQPPLVTVSEAVWFLLGITLAICVHVVLKDSDEDKLQQYRAILIRNGAAEYRADTDGEPVFVIIDKQHQQRPQ